MSAIEPGPAPFASLRLERGLEFVRRIYLPRTAGLALGAVAIAPVLWANGARPLLWLALALSTLAWPHLAYRLGMASADPYSTERRSLTIDSALGGAFIALMKFNLLPSVLLVVMLSMDKLAVGGPRFLARCTLALVTACAIAAWAAGFEVRPDTTLPEILGCLPLFVVYPLAVGITSYNMAKRMSYQSRQLEAMSRTDGMSRMLMRRAWEELVIEEFMLCRRTGSPSSILLLDIDDMKRINERHGYPVGDEVIRSVASILRDSLRAQDVAARYGGEKFAALLPGADAAQAEEIAGRAREAVASALLEQGAQVSGSVSIGVAQLDAGGGHADWIAHADEALHAAKMQGGNCAERYRAPKPVFI